MRTKRNFIYIALMICLYGNVWAKTGVGLSNIFSINNHNSVSSEMSNIFTIDNRTVKAAADITKDDKVDGFDLNIITQQWLSQPGEPSGDIEPESRDNIVNLLDFSSLAQYWLEGVE